MLNNRKKILGLQHNVFFLGLVSLFNDFSAEMVYSVMPAFLTVVLGAPPVFLGFMEGFVDAFASLLKIFSGWLSDKVGSRKWFAVIGYALSVGTRSMLALVTGLGQVFSLRIVDRLGKGLRDAPRDALLSESVSQSELGKSFGYHRAMDTTGAILGPLSAIILLPILAYNYRQLFLVSFVVGIFAVVSFIFVREVKTKEEIKPKTPVLFSFSLKNFGREFKLYLWAVFIFGMGVMPVALMLLKVKDLGLDGVAMPLFYLVYTITFAISAIPMGSLADKIGEKKILTFGFLWAILGYLILAYANTIITTIIGFIIFGLYSAMTDGVERAWASKLVPTHQLAQGQGFLQSAVGLSSLVGGSLGGLIWTYYGSSLAFFYGAAMMTVGSLFFVVVIRMKR